MKKIKKFIIKNKFKFLMIIFVLIGGVVGVAAATIFPSSEVSYDNDTSGLSSTTVQGAIDELDNNANSCRANLADSDSSLMVLGVTPVTTGDGLYADPMESERYIYKGANPNNYICLDSNTSGTCADDNLYRIFSIEPDGTLKLIKENSVISMVFDANDATRRKTGYCTDNYCNAWAAMSIFTNGTYTGVVAGLNGNTGDSSIKEYIDNTYAPTLANYSNMIVTKTWDIGGTTANRDTLENAIADEEKTTWNGKIALLTASEYVRANSNTDTCGTLALLYSNYSTCKSTNYLHKSSHWWLLSPSSSHRDLVLDAYDGYVRNNTPSLSSGVRPVFHLKSGLNLTGKGTNDANVYRPERIPAPTYSQSGLTVTITYPAGCGSTYTCSYSKDGGASVNVTSTTANVTFNSWGNLVASVTHGNNTVYSSYTVVYTGTIYRNNTNVLFNGLTYNGEATVWYPTNRGYSSAAEAHADYYTFSSQAYCEAGNGSGNCTSGTVTLSAGSYETNASNLNKTYYLKHTITNDIVTASYVCFVTDTEHCMQGGDSSYYSANRTLLESQQTWFNNHSGSCSFDSGGSYCNGGGFNVLYADLNGYVDAYVSDDDRCYVSYYGTSNCYVSS